MAPPEEKPNGDNGDEAAGDVKGGGETHGGITSPEGVLMLIIAGIVDLISIIPVINVASNVIGIIVIGGWLVITRPGEALKKAVKRFLITCGIELIPIVSIAPSWTWFVYKTLNDG